MAEPAKKPAPLEEVEVPAGALDAPAIDDSAEYQSSEQLQRAHNADVFARESAKKDEKKITEKNKVKKLLDKYIDEHKDTSKVRDTAKANERTAEYQLDLSADIVLVLRKIKKELR